MTDTLPFAVVRAFLTRVSFASRSRHGPESAGAYLHLEDDADCHKFKVAVPALFATEMARRLSDDDFGGFEEDPQIFISFAPTRRAGERQPDLEQLLAVWEASTFMLDYARDEHMCAVCDGALPGHVDYAKENHVRRCNESCVGAILREARSLR